MEIIDSIKLLATVDPKATIAVLSPFVTFILNRLFSPSVKLYHSIRHQFHYILDIPLLDESGRQISPSQSAIVQSFSIVNAGRMPAKNVELVFNWKPNFVNTWPIRKYETYAHPDGRYSIQLSNLAPKEVFGLELLYLNMELPNIITVRSEEVESKMRKMIPQVQFSSWFNGFVLILMISGLISLVYAILTVLAFAIS